MSKEILVVGGGIVGLSTAYFLNKEGHKVTVFDKGEMTTGASHVNAGYISPSHIIPLSAPGVMKKGLKWMFNSSSPLYIKPRLNSEFLKWAWAFNKSCTSKHVEQSIPVIKDISLLSEAMFKELMHQTDFDPHYEKKGLLMLCRTQKMLEIETNLLRKAEEVGLQGRVISRDELKQMEPDVDVEVVGAVLFECDAHSTPPEFMQEFEKLLIKKGVTIEKNQEVSAMKMSEGTLTKVQVGDKEYSPDEVIVTAGAWSKKLCKQLGINLLLEGGKGYCIDSKRDLGIRYPAIIAEPKVAITPMNGFTRFAGTMEFSGINNFIRKERVEAIAEAVKSAYPEIELTTEEKANATSGLRPVTPDGLPYIGKPNGCSNVTIAAGHAMLGWTLGPATGKLVSEIIDNKPTSMALDAFSPNRKF